MSSTFKDVLSQVKKQIKEVTVHEVEAKLRRAEDLVLLDVRERDEWDEGHVAGAIFLPRGFLEVKVEQTIPNKEAPIIVYCAGGVRSALAAKSLEQLGYKNVVSMAGGFGEWKNNNYKFVVPQKIGKDQMLRYSRHFKIPEVGEKGQMKLLASKVLLIGGGGLGSPAAVYLAASGVGTLGIVDFDVVDESNLQRQILHWTSSVGIPKTDSARRTLYEVNPDVKVKTYNARIDPSNVLDILPEYDVVIDGCDNFATRYLINDACVMLDKPLVFGSIFRFEGQASTFIPHNGPCYRCVYPVATPAELAPNCAEIGVLGVLPGTVGLIQATEAIKLLLNIGETLSGRLLVYDALSMSFRQFKLRRDPDCKTCGPNASIELTLADVGCALPSH